MRDATTCLAPDNEELAFAAEPVTAAPRPLAPWKILIVDDEEEVHTLTWLVLKNYTFEGRGVELISAYSGVSARTLVREDPDIALILLDVVMEREDSGLRLVRYIRDELQNKNVRIILRTGQPGQAPEMEVVAQYDINDYKSKVDLTAQKLFTTVTSALRSWRDIQTIDRSRQGLQRVLDASSALFECRSRGQFISSVLDQLMSLAAGDASGLAARLQGDEYVIHSSRGSFGACRGRTVAAVVPDSTELMVEKATRQGADLFFNNSFVSCIQGENGQGVLFLLKGGSGLVHLDRDLIRIYMANVAMAFHNVNLSREIIDTQKEIIHTLGEVVETRSKETANHVLRVGKMAHRLGKLTGLDDEDAAILRLSAPMHDVGKVGIPDEVLNKPGKLTPSEYELMQNHSVIGHEILGKSERRIMRSAARVALQHHEKWDGSGYPNGLAGQDIDLFSRITALVDVFDAVANHRVYRDAWNLDQVVEMLHAERGLHFDPELVDIFLENLDEFVGIIRAHPDRSAPSRRFHQGHA
jgi:response regulator RpfG family c-di-GMP phosphodiesterase